MALEIFVTVGTQLPFDRLVGAVDAWAARRPEASVFAQIGDGRAPHHAAHARDLHPADFAGRLANADVIVAHAGMGTILTALDLGKPVLVMPRRADLGEHRNDHQLATVARLSHLEALRAVADEDALAAALDGFTARGAGAHAPDHGLSPARQDLVRAVAAFVAGGPQPC